MENTQQAPAEGTPAPELSVEERFAQAFGLTDEKPAEQTADPAEDAEAQDAEQEASPEDDQGEEVEFEGEKYLVPKQIKDALLRQSDYTKKTQEVAEQRKAIEAERERVQQHVQAWQAEQAVQQQMLQHIGKVQAIDTQLADFAKIDWATAIDSDPVAALKLQQRYQSLKEDRNTALQEAMNARQQIFQAQAQAQAQYLQEAEQKLQAELPGWGSDLKASLRETGKSYGFTDQELSGVTDPRVVKLMADAMAWRKAQADNTAARTKVSNAPKPLAVKATPKQSERDVLRKVIRTSKDKQTKHAAISKLVERMF